jgi:hypothetical protein
VELSHFLMNYMRLFLLNELGNVRPGLRGHKDP